MVAVFVVRARNVQMCFTDWRSFLIDKQLPLDSTVLQFCVRSKAMHVSQTLAQELPLHQFHSTIRVVPFSLKEKALSAVVQSFKWHQSVTSPKTNDWVQASGSALWHMSVRHACSKHGAPNRQQHCAHTQPIHTLHTLVG